MKRKAALLLAAVLVLTLAACGKKQTQIANPWRDVETLQEAEEAVGFTIQIPGEVPGYEKKTFRACTADGGKIIEVCYTNVNDESVVIRKGEGSEDISGDYNSYDSEAQMEIDDCVVSLRGNGSGVNVAVWQRGGCTYAISVGQGMYLEEIVELIAAVK